MVHCSFVLCVCPSLSHASSDDHSLNLDTAQPFMSMTPMAMTPMDMTPMGAPFLASPSAYFNTESSPFAGLGLSWASVPAAPVVNTEPGTSAGSSDDDMSSASSVSSGGVAAASAKGKKRAADSGTALAGLCVAVPLSICVCVWCAWTWVYMGLKSNWIVLS